MFGKPDLNLKEVPPPHQNWCSSGHAAPEKFARHGEALPEEPTKFFQVSSLNNPSANGVYCEPCVIVSNAISRGEVQVRRR
jgi:hypothetical protein